MAFLKIAKLFNGITNYFIQSYEFVLIIPTKISSRGMNDTTALEKRVTAVVNASFSID